MGESRGIYRVFMGTPEERDHFGDQSIDGRVILRWIFRN